MRILKITLLILALSFSLNGIALFKRETNEVYYDRFKEVFQKLEKDYVKEPKKQELLDAAIEGMLSSLDPHSSFFADEDLEFFVSNTSGEFGGVGIEIIFESGAIKVISPIDDLPAHKAGIKAGDFIVKVNDEFVNNLGYNKAIKELRGKAGTKVNVTVIREGESKPLNFEIERQIVKIDAVKSRVENNVAYLRVSSFTEKVAKELNDEIKKLTSNNKNNIEGIILDLRNNPGGLLEQAVDVSSMFIKEGVVVSTKGRNISSELVMKAKKTSTKAPNLPLVVLINGGSASASEIVAGALQDHKRAILVGTKTYGKGSVQTLFPLDNRSAMKFTTALYYTPNGRSIQAEGIEPDIKIEYAKVEYPKKEKDELRFSEAALRNHIKNENSIKNTTKNNKSKEKISSDNKENKKESEFSDYYFNDFQYARAYDILQGIIIQEKRDGRK